MKRILSLDGGGIRGVFSLEVLRYMQGLLRTHYNSPNLVLADHFDFFAGTSTGAIIAACLCWGMEVEAILDVYLKYGKTMFQHVPWYRPFKRLLISRFEAKPLSQMLQRMFSEDGNGEAPALLGTNRLRKLLLVVVRNHTTGSAWPVSNNPMAKFNDTGLSYCNLRIPLWKLVRASTAAPVYFDPEEITLGDRTYIFEDGGITPYNNPALIAALTAVLPCYRLNWVPGPENIRLVSLGTLRFSSGLPAKVRKLWLGYNVSRIPTALMQGITWEQDYLCRSLGECIYGESLDEEIGDQVKAQYPGGRWFGYVRYNQSFDTETVEKLLQTNRQLTQLDAVLAVPLLQKIGSDYAKDHVKLGHLI
ncbi:patatin-like phospholipase family protein [Telmatobacter sp. DSM 110680]|uniref:Patatin-like phospholipase family protein n=1 Tax=Telmatobacter sp. DSM 110680 TaxID=3036704 RepID=A0AAU7DNR3_9BACT